jgi:hypothetical protein
VTSVARHRPRRARPVSLLHEIYATLKALVEGARILIDAAENRELGAEHDAVRAPRTASAVLSLAICRLEELCGVLRRETDAAGLAAHFNMASGEPGEVALGHAKSRR